MSQAIITKFISATNTRGARIKATSWHGSVTIPYDHALSEGRAHRAAADALCVKRGLHWRIVAQASMPDGRGYAFTSEYDPE
jgi:hypothetical protein